MNGAIGTIIAIACIITCIWRVCSINDSSETTYSGHTASSVTSGEYLDYVAPGRSPVSQRSYRFQIKRVGEEYRAYILNSPSYLNRSTDGHSTHPIMTEGITFAGVRLSEVRATWLTSLANGQIAPRNISNMELGFDD